jgi:hypothetical protein
MTSTFSSALEIRTKDGVKFGKELREKEFLFDQAYLPLNHGMCIICRIVSEPWCCSTACFVVSSFDYYLQYHNIISLAVSLKSSDYDEPLSSSNGFFYMSCLRSIEGYRQHL